MATVNPTGAKQFVSHSKLQKFHKCAKSYDYHYNQKLYRGDTSSALMSGGIVHEALEAYYRDEVKHPFVAVEAYWTKWFKDRGLEHVTAALDELATDVNHINWRASAACTDRNVWIRNRDGSIPKSLTMNAGYKAAAAQLQLEDRYAYVDNQGWQSGLDRGISLTEVYSLTRSLLENYKEITGLTKVMAVEFPFSDQRVDDQGAKITDRFGIPEVANPVVLPKSGDWFKGYVDLIAKVNGKVAIIDHKTSKGDSPELISVMYHDQLLMYAWAYEQLFHEKPYYIGINHLRTGTCVLVPIDWDRVADTVERFDTTTLATKGEHFPKKSAFDYMSPCTGGAKTLTEATRICSYFDLCYPQLAEMVNPVVTE